MSMIPQCGHTVWGKRGIEVSSPVAPRFGVRRSHGLHRFHWRRGAPWNKAPKKTPRFEGPSLEEPWRSSKIQGSLLGSKTPRTATWEAPTCASTHWFRERVPRKHGVYVDMSDMSCIQMFPDANSENFWDLLLIKTQVVLVWLRLAAIRFWAGWNPQIIVA